MITIYNSWDARIYVIVLFDDRFVEIKKNLKIAGTVRKVVDTRLLSVFFFYSGLYRSFR